ncbi:WxL protein peptidoglycan domain-containing protein [Actinoplanes sp. HUAS TT8]|uniref:WxL protein peptidoglycan domain-containing protein n=1 Tax=Actinoplanes sp. HUAS TT8 TaxID=3447453 RepID=UPI003F51E0FE
MVVRGVLAAVLLLVPAPAPAEAAPAQPSAAPSPAATGGSDVRWSVQPSTAKGPDGRDYIIRRAAPGERLTDYVGVTNLTARPLTFSVYGTDAYTTDDGSFALLPAVQKPTDIGSWMTLGAARYTVPANTRLDVPFAISVPADATPGDHAGGVVASIAEEQAAANGQKVLVDRRVAARVYLTVAGAVAPTLKIDSVRLEYAQSTNPADGGVMTVKYLVHNTGNLRLSGTGTVRVTGPFGWELARTGGMEIPELLPGGSVTVTEKILGVQPTVRLAADVSVVPASFDQKLPSISRGTGVWAWPWALVALLGVLISYVIIRIFVKRRRARVAALDTVPAPAA